MNTYRLIISCAILLFSSGCKKGEDTRDLLKKTTQDSIIVKIPNEFGVGVETINADSDDTLEYQTQVCPVPFEVFFDRFGKDSVFQKSRVKFPLKWSYFGDDYEKLIVKYVDIKEFFYIDFSEDKNAMERESGKYEVVIEKNNDEINYLLKGYDNGLYMTYAFKLIEECWYLVEIIDEST